MLPLVCAEEGGGVRQDWRAGSYSGNALHDRRDFFALRLGVEDRFGGDDGVYVSPERVVGRLRQAGAESSTPVHEPVTTHSHAFALGSAVQAALETLTEKTAPRIWRKIIPQRGFVGLMEDRMRNEVHN